MRAAALLVLLLAGAALAGDLPMGGTVTLADDLVVGPGDALVLAPGTLVVGPGRLVVHGALRAEGTPREPVRIETSVVLDGDGESVLASTRFLGAGTALAVHGARVRLFDVAFEDVGEGIVADGADIVVRGARFRDAAGRPLDADGGRLRAEDLLFAGNARPARLAASDGADLALANATFAGEGLEVRATGAGRVEVAGSLFAGGPDAAVRVAGPGNATVASASNAFVDVPVAFALAGEGFRVVSTGDRFDGCRAAADGDGLAVVREATYARGCAFRTAEAARGTLPFLAGAAALALLAAGWATSRAGARVLGRRLGEVDRARLLAALSPEGDPADELARALGLPRGATARALDEAVAEGAAARTEDGRFAAPRRAEPRGPSPTERRILEEIAARPGRAQSDIAGSLGLSRQALHYHVKKLEREGLVTKVVRGRETLCYPKGAEPSTEAGRLS